MHCVMYMHRDLMVCIYADTAIIGIYAYTPWCLSLAWEHIGNALEIFCNTSCMENIRNVSHRFQYGNPISTLYNISF
jgi:hypothetical protein